MAVVLLIPQCGKFCGGVHVGFAGESVSILLEATVSISSIVYFAVFHNLNGSHDAPVVFFWSLTLGGIRVKGWSGS